MVGTKLCLIEDIVADLAVGLNWSCWLDRNQLHMFEHLYSYAIQQNYFVKDYVFTSRVNLVIMIIEKIESFPLFTASSKHSISKL